MFYRETLSEVAMSRGAGWVERAIEAAFTSGSNRAFTVDELVLAVYVDVNRVEKKHRVAVLRAAHNVRQRLGWCTKACDVLVFYNPVDVRSTAQAQLRQFAADDIRRGGSRQFKADMRALDDPSIDVPWRRHMGRGGKWWEWVEIERCRRSG